MTCTTVRTQVELNDALADNSQTCIHIESERGVWLSLSSSGSATVRASGSATVRASGSATVRAYDSATVEAYDSATVQAYDSATVQAYDSATVRAYDSATVEAYDSATVEAYGSAGVHAHNESRITAGPHVAVHLHSAQATVDGGVLIDLTVLDLTDPQTWCDHHGVTVADGRAVLHKAVDNDLMAGGRYTPTEYPIGAEVTCGDWRDDNDCGGGLHLSPRPYQAASYRSGPGRYLRVSVDLADLRPIPSGGDAPKCKTPRLRVECEVDSHGRELAVTR